MGAVSSDIKVVGYGLGAKSFIFSKSGMDLEPTRFPSDHTDFVRAAEVTGASTQLHVCV